MRQSEASSEGEGSRRGGEEKYKRRNRRLQMPKRSREQDGKQRQSEEKQVKHCFGVFYCIADRRTDRRPDLPSSLSSPPPSPPPFPSSLFSLSFLARIAVIINCGERTGIPKGRSVDSTGLPPPPPSSHQTQASQKNKKNMSKTKKNGLW